MKNHKTLFIFGFLFSAFISSGQWHMLGGYSPVNIFCPPPGSITPMSPLPTGNGTIFYGSLCLPGASGDFCLMKSTNDLDTSVCALSIADYGCCSNPLSVYKDSSNFAELIGEASFLRVYYISRSTDIYNVGNFFPGINCYTPGPMALAPHMLYCTSKCINLSNDSLLIYCYSLPSGPLIHKYEVMDSLPSQICFVNDNSGFMLCNGAKSLLLKTSTYGMSWTTSYVDSVNNLVSFCFPTVNTGYFVKGNGDIYKTTNCGTTWAYLTTNSVGINCISFADSNIGYVGGTSGFLNKTMDGGLTWTTELSNDAGNSIEQIYCIDTSVAYFRDAGNNLFKNKPSKHSPVKNFVHLYPNPSLDGHFTLEVSGFSGNVNMDIYNMLGQKVYSLTGYVSPQTDEKMEAVIPKIPGGIYYYKVISSNGSLLLKGKLAIK